MEKKKREHVLFDRQQRIMKKINIGKFNKKHDNMNLGKSEMSPLLSNYLKKKRDNPLRDKGVYIGI